MHASKPWCIPGPINGLISEIVCEMAGPRKAQHASGHTHLARDHPRRQHSMPRRALPAAPARAPPSLRCRSPLGQRPPRHPLPQPRRLCLRSPRLPPPLPPWLPRLAARLAQQYLECYLCRSVTAALAKRFAEGSTVQAGHSSLQRVGVLLRAVCIVQRRVPQPRKQQRRHLHHHHPRRLCQQLCAAASSQELLLPAADTIPACYRYAAWGCAYMPHRLGYAHQQQRLRAGSMLCMHASTMAAHPTCPLSARSGSGRCGSRPGRCSARSRGSAAARRGSACMPAAPARFSRNIIRYGRGWH